MMNIVLQNGSSNPFDSIRRIDENGIKYWIADEIIALIGLPLKTHHIKLSAEQAGLLILEASAMLSMKRYYGATADATYLHSEAMNIYAGQSTTFVFHSVMANIMRNTCVWEEHEQSIYPYIQEYWDKIKPFRCDLVKDLTLESQENKPDFFAKKR